MLWISPQKSGSEFETQTQKTLGVLWHAYTSTHWYWSSISIHSIVLWQAEGLFNEAFPSKHIKTLPLCLHPMMMDNQHNQYHWKFVIIRVSLAETTTIPRGYKNEALKTKCALLHVQYQYIHNTIHTHTQIDQCQMFEGKVYSCPVCHRITYTCIITNLKSAGILAEHHKARTLM